MKLFLTVLAAGTGVTLGLTHSHAHAAHSRPQANASVTVPDDRTPVATATSTITGVAAIGAPAAAPQTVAASPTPAAAPTGTLISAGVGVSAADREPQRINAPMTAPSGHHESERVRDRGVRGADTTSPDPTPASPRQRSHAAAREDDSIENIVAPSVLQQLVNAEQQRGQ